MKNINLKRFISVVCALVLLITAVFEPGWFSTANENVDEVSAADTEPPTDFTELKWTDFTGLAYQEYVAPNPDTGAKGTYSGDLNQTLLNGNIIMGSDVDIRFAGAGWTGLMIRTLTDGTLCVENSTFDTSYSKVYQPADYGLTSFIGNEFNLKISTEISGTSYTFGIWVNDKMLGDYFTLTEAGSDAGTSIGMYKRDGGNNIELLPAPVKVPTDFRELKWVDFTGLAYQEYVAPNPDTGAKGTYSGSLHQTLLNGDIIMGYDTDLRFAGTGWSGLAIQTLTDGTLWVHNNTFDTSYSKVYQPADYGLTSFIDNKFNLKISTEISGNNYTFGIWVNDKILGDYFTLTEAGGEAGTSIGLYHRGSNYNVTLVKMPVNLPTDFRELKWVDFTGLAYQEYAAPNPDTGAKGTYSGDLNKTMLNGNIIMGANSDIRYAGSNGWAGLAIIANADGTLSINSSTFDTSYAKTYSASDYGLTSFVGVEFNLKITTEINGNNYKFSVWVNNQVLDDYFTLTEASNEKGTTLGLYHRGSNNSITLVKMPVNLPTDFTEIGWTDFTGLTYQEYVAPNPDTGSKGTYSGDLNKTLFNGNITMGYDTDIRYAGSNGWAGLVIQTLTDGTLWVYNGTFDTSYSKIYQPADYGLTSFINEEFNLKITTEINGNDYKFSVWVNNQVLDDYFTLTEASNEKGTTVGLYHRGSNNNITLDEASLEAQLPTNFTILKWSDFTGLEYKEYVATTPDEGGKGTYSGSLHQTMLDDNIIFGGNTDIRYGGTGWSGIVLEVAADGSVLYVRGGTYDESYTKEYYPADYGLTSFMGVEFNLKITTEISGDDYTFSVWVNNQVLGDYFTLTKNADTAAGSCVGLYDRDSGNSITLKKAPINPPTDFTTLGWTDFTGLICKEYVATTPDAGGKGTYSGSLHQTLLDGDIIFGGNTDIRYGGTGWSGIVLEVAANGSVLYMRGGTFDDSYTKEFYPADYGLASFKDTKFNLKISTEISGDNYTFGVWINNQILGNYFTLTKNENTAAGSCVGLYDRGSGNSITLVGEQVPTDYTILTPLTSFGIASGSYTAENGASSVDAPTEAVSKFDKVILQFHKITYEGNVDLGWGGENVWVGFRLRSNATDGTLTFQSGYSGGSGVGQLIPTPTVLTDAIAGVDLVGGTYNLKISMVYTDENTIKMGIWFNDILYNNEYFMVDISTIADYETGDKLGVHLGVVSQNGGGTITFGEEEITLNPTYWNKADGAYTVPSTTTDINGNSITELNTVGDNYITYSLNGKIYERYVYIWEIGDVKADDEVDSRDLVRAKKLSLGGGGDTTNAGKEAADFDKNTVVDSTDVESMRRLLLGDVFEYGMTLSEKMLGEGNENVMPILGYYAPATSWAVTAADGNSYVSKDTVNETMYQLIADLGINLITASNDTYTDSNKEVIEKQLQLAQAKGLSLFVRDGRISGSTAISQEELQCYLDGYESFDSFAGLHLIDEPSTEDYHAEDATNYTMDNYGTLSKMLSNTPETVGYVNLLPYYGNLANNGTTSYQNYLNTYVEKYNPQYLSFDYYLFGKTDGWWIFQEDLTVADGEEYMQNLAMIRSTAKNNNIPFWSYVQAGENWNDGKNLMESTANDNNTPTEGEFKWQANIALAFGAQGIQYFPLIQPHYFALTEGGSMDYDRNGLIAEDGSTNQWYGYAQTVNTQIAAIDEVLMNATHKGIIAASGYAANVIDSSLNNLGDSNLVISSYDTLQSVSTTGSTYGAVVGCFDYNGKTALYVVNYDVETSRNITLNFSESVTADVTISGASSEKSGNAITLTLGAGEGALVVLK